MMIGVMKNSPPEHRRDLTLKEVAYQMSVHAEWIRTRLGTDEVPPFFRRGKRIFFLREGFNEWLKSRTTYPPHHNGKTSNV